jgi:exopolyphosphatase / guanosine-5'-triphosphate,3'-diphosphate pyrophosphatase
VSIVMLAPRRWWQGPNILEAKHNRTMPTPSLPAPEAPLAAVDMGSNSFRLEIARVMRGRYERIDYIKETVRLGGGLDGNGQLGEEAAERGLASLRRFAARLQGFAPTQVRAVATQTLREAKNRDAFLLRAQAALGHSIEVISGREEARLIYAGVAHLQPSERRRLVVDIGGRSTEMILGRGNDPIRAESFAVGSVSLSMRHFGDGRLTAAAFRAAQVAAGAELEEALQPFAPSGWEEALGSSGTAGAVSQLVLAMGHTDGAVTPQRLRDLIERCIAAGHVDKLELPGLKTERKPVIAGGLALLYTFAAQFGIERLLPAKGALRQGVIVELNERLSAQRRSGGGAPHGDRRDATVRDIQRRFDADAAQAARVRAVALALYGDLAPDDDEGARELGWAADLHEIGLAISHHDHHRHSAYLVGHLDAPAFSQTEQRHIAAIVLGQRGGLRKLEAELGDKRFARQVLALRIAVIKCHARGPVDARALRLAADGKERARVSFSEAWAASHPRTLYLLEQEAEAWSKSGAYALALGTSVEDWA